MGPRMDGTRVVGKAELALHNKRGDAWVAIRNKVYDVTEFAKEHPGGPVLYTYAGKDATDVFAAFHEAQTWHRLPGLCIGEYQVEEPPSELVEDVRRLKAEMLQKGMFRSSPLFYAYKIATTLLLLGASLGVTAACPTSILCVCAGACLLGLFWQQCGWLSHDFCHNQVFKNRWLNHVVGGLGLGNVAQGFSVSWWKFKHNTHHAAPNECDHSYAAVDPDIDTLPFLAWSEEMMTTVQSKALRKVLRWQRELFLPMLLFARVAWCHSSLSFCFSSAVPESFKHTERALLVLHYACLLGFPLAVLPPGMALLWLGISQAVGGALLGIVFVQSHNGMEVYNEDKDFYTAQIISTRDVKVSAVNDWFSGGLNRQIEHHLFPTLPRHSLKEASRMVAVLCEKHGLKYEDVDWSTGTGLVLRHLAKVAARA